MRRRQFVAALPLAVGLAGCLDRTGRADDGRTEEQSSEVATGSATVTTTPDPLSVTLRSSFRYYHSNGAIGVETPERAQFAFVTAPVADAEPSAFTLALGDGRVSPWTSVPGFMNATPGVDGVYGPEGTGTLVFDVPTVDTDRAALRYEGTRYEFPAEAVQRFVTAPAISIDAVSVPERLAPTDEVDVTVTATNAGAVDGLVLGGLRTGGQPETFEFSVPAGGTVEKTTTYYRDGGTDTFSLSFSAHDEARWITIPVETKTPTQTATESA